MKLFVAASCPALEDPAEGEVVITGERYMDGRYAVVSRAEYSCHEGFRTHGYPVLHCNSIGRWTRRIPICNFEGTEMNSLFLISFDNSVYRKINRLSWCVHR